MYTYICKYIYLNDRIDYVYASPIVDLNVYILCCVVTSYFNKVSNGFSTFPCIEFFLWKHLFLPLLFLPQFTCLSERAFRTVFVTKLFQHLLSQCTDYRTTLNWLQLLPVN